MEPQRHLILNCKSCGHPNEFNQPYPYHAGFSDMGFLYNEGGNSTLCWNMYDPYFLKLFPEVAAWGLNPVQKEHFESVLPLSPKGDRWLFSAPARCSKCKNPIAEAMGGSSIYYLVYPGSINVSGPGLKELWLDFYCTKPS